MVTKSKSIPLGTKWTTNFKTKKKYFHYPFKYKTPNAYN